MRTGRRWRRLGCSISGDRDESIGGGQSIRRIFSLERITNVTKLLPSKIDAGETFWGSDDGPVAFAGEEDMEILL